jgi:hypothetical protein
MDDCSAALADDDEASCGVCFGEQAATVNTVATAARQMTRMDKAPLTFPESLREKSPFPPFRFRRDL